MKVPLFLKCPRKSLFHFRNLEEKYVKNLNRRSSDRSAVFSGHVKNSIFPGWHIGGINLRFSFFSLVF